jgi:membrane-bound lytic murein transglycosylase B
MKGKTSTRGRRFVVRTLAVLILCAPSAPFAMDVEREDVRRFMDDLSSNHNFDQAYLRSMLGQGQSKEKILEAISRPAERTKPWYEYRAIFLTPKRIDAGVDFWQEHSAQLRKISADTGVPEEIIAAIIGVETFYGRIVGGYRVLDALSTLAFDYPPRSKFFRSELEQFFLLAREEELDLISINGSYAGAMGPPQFIPSSYRHYAVDGDGDGSRDLLGNWDDILASVANYFVKNGWQPNQPVAVESTANADIDAPVGKNRLKLDETVSSLAGRGLEFDTDLGASAPAQLISLEGEDGQELWVGFHNFYVITRYNRSAMYALAVYQLAEALACEMRESGCGGPTVALRDNSSP